MKARWLIALWIVVMLSSVADGVAQPVPLSGPEKIYSELAALPQAERSARIVSTVVGWSPRPNDAPGSMRITVVPSGTSRSIHAGTTTRSLRRMDRFPWTVTKSRVLPIFR